MENAEWIALVAAAAGAFLGSGSAFLLESLRQDRRAREQQLLALNQAEFVVNNQLASLVAFRQVHLESHRYTTDREVTLGHIILDLPELPLSLEALAFLAGKGKGGLLHRISESRCTYQNVVTMIARREEALSRALYSESCALHQFDDDTGEASVSPDPRHYADLRLITNALYDSVDTAIESHQLTLQHVREAAEARS